jgi:hypothetical protein
MKKCSVGKYLTILVMYVNEKIIPSDFFTE